MVFRFFRRRNSGGKFSKLTMRAKKLRCKLDKVDAEIERTALKELWMNAWEHGRCKFYTTKEQAEAESGDLLEVRVARVRIRYTPGQFDE